MTIGANLIQANSYRSYRMYFLVAGGGANTGIQDSRNSYLYGGGVSHLVGISPSVVNNLGNSPTNDTYGNFSDVPRPFVKPPTSSGEALLAFPGRIGKMPILIPVANKTQNPDGSGGSWIYG